MLSHQPRQTVVPAVMLGTVLFFGAGAITACLPKKKDKSIERQAVTSCAAGVATCHAARAAWALADVSGPLSRLQVTAGFTPAEAVQSGVARQAGDRVVRLSSQKTAASADLVKDSQQAAGKAEMGSPVELLFRSRENFTDGAGWFLREAADADKIAVESFKPSPAGVSVLKLPAKELAQGDLILMRGAIPVGVRYEDRVACAGMTMEIQVRGAGLEKPLPAGRVPFDQLTLHRTLFLNAAAKIPEAGTFSLELALTGDKPGCNVKILEPATFTLMVFTRMTRLAEFSASAKFLVDSSVSDANDFSPPASVATLSAGSPIVTLARKDWLHEKDDFLMVDASVTLTAGDRFSETTGWLQLSRSPSGLNSHLAASSQVAQEGAVLQRIHDWAYSASGDGRTTFYLSVMSTGENAKPLAIKDPKMVFLHFGGIKTGGEKLSLADAQRPKVASGRMVDLYLIRAQMDPQETRPSEDSLPCRFFQPGTYSIAGAPALDVPSPVHRQFKTRWVGTNIVFPIIFYENIYRQAPVWTLRPPAGRENHYADRFYEVTVTNPGSVSCSASAVRR